MENDKTENGSLADARSPEAPRNPIKQKETRIPLTQEIVRTLPVTGKPYSKGDSYVVGFRVYVSKEGYKSYSLSYRKKGYPHPLRSYIGSAQSMSLKTARLKAKKLSVQISEGKDPQTLKKLAKEGMTLGEVKDLFFAKELKKPAYQPSTIRNYRSGFKCWLEGDTTDQSIVALVRNNPKLVDKPLVTITDEDAEALLQMIGEKSEAMANKIIRQLKKVCNFAIRKKLIKTNPFKIPKDKMFRDKEDNRYIRPKHLELIKSWLIKIDKRSGALNLNAYREEELNPVSCCLIAFWFLTGRRNWSEGASIIWDQISFQDKTIWYAKTKTKDSVTYKLGPRVLKLLKAIRKAGLLEGPFNYSDIRKDCVFPSPKFGQITKRGKNKSPHVTDCRNTWKRMLKQFNLDYLPMKNQRHSYLTNGLHKTGNVYLMMKLAGHLRVTTTQRYAQMLGEDVTRALEHIDKEEVEPKLLELKKA